MKVFIFSILSIFAFSAAKSQIFIDTVYSVNWGNGQDLGRSKQYFPQNIFGAASSKATQFTPESAEEEICSLGKGGEIIVGSKDCYIVDKPGADFVVFENVFSTSTGAKIFVEPAIISVSKDGINFVDFPYNSNTLKGLAGIAWTIGNISPNDFPNCGGDGFDLAEIGMDSITHIKIKDISSIVSTLPYTNPFYSPEATVSGFDLDAVAILNFMPKVEADNFVLDISGSSINFSSSTPHDIKIFDILGNIINSESNVCAISYSKYSFLSGTYFISISSRKSRSITSKKISLPYIQQ